ncbi:MAG TPA: hypothetical protein VGE02_08585 [Gemmatimonadales bacterium]
MTQGRRLPAALVLALAAATICTPDLGAQQRDSLRAGAARLPGDSVSRDTIPRDSALGVQLPQPPLSPRRAFITSVLVPGYAQARLERPVASALFFTVEAAGVLMLRKSLDDLRVARRFEGDSIVVRWELDPATGEPVIDPETGERVPAEKVPGRFTPELVQARRTHVEDWIAVLVFNHLLAGADAFVSAHLWDVPAGVSLGVTPTPRGGAAVVASFRW